MTKEKTAAIKTESADRYLLTILSSEESATDKVIESIKSLELTLEKAEQLGRRTLAYPIDKRNELHVCSFFIKGLPELIKKLDLELKHQETVTRYLLTKWSAEIPTPREDRRGKR